MAVRIEEFQGKRVHMIGIGGSSMSGLAQMLKRRGYLVQGSDRDDGYLLDMLRGEGIPVMIGHRAEHVHGVDLVVYTAAIPPENPERMEAQRLNIPTMERSLMLGEWMGQYDTAIAVCGTHGKTTATGMLSAILMGAGMDPSIHVGGQMELLHGSTRVGEAPLFLAEACEFNRSFLDMHPTHILLLNVDADHLDCYRDIDEIEETFGIFLQRLPANGTVYGWGEDYRALRQMQQCGKRYLTFGWGAAYDLHPENVQEDQAGYFSFDVVFQGKQVAHLTMGVPGRFNALDGLGALLAAIDLGVPPQLAADCLATFRGVHRRLEKTSVLNGADIYHDYGHNPTEMKNVLSVARKLTGGRLIAVMQPHTYSRVRTLFDDFLTCTQEADITLVTDICAAREPVDPTLHAAMLVEGMHRHGIHAVLTPSFDDAEAWLRQHLQPGDLALTMGCGDINLLNAQIKAHDAEQAM